MRLEMMAPIGVKGVRAAANIVATSNGERKYRWNPQKYGSPLNRLGLLAVLVLLPFWGVFRKIGGLIADGSPMVYLTVIPVLLALIAIGYRTPPLGVGDPESDWILAALFGGLGLFLRHLMSHRFPTLSGLWQLPLVGAVLWAACLSAVLFGVRRVMQMWAFWAFAVATVTPLPYLLTNAAVGSAPAGAALVGGLGGVAVLLATRTLPLTRRLVAGAATAVSGIAISAGAVWSGAESSADRLMLVLFTGGFLPTVAVLVVNRLRASARACAAVPLKSVLPRRSPLSLVVLCGGAAVVLVLNAPFRGVEERPSAVRADWPARLGLSVSERFSFIQRYLGPTSTFDRFAVPGAPDTPQAAVDVITAHNLAALRTYRDAVWYPATVPPNYRAIDLGVIGAREAATDSSLATNAEAGDWYVVTWLWQAAETYQQVFVVVNQTWTSQAPPAEPAPLSVRATVIGPALWLIRQQPDPAMTVDPPVTARARQIVAQLFSAGGLRDDR